MDKKINNTKKIHYDQFKRIFWHSNILLVIQTTINLINHLKDLLEKKITRIIFFQKKYPL